MTTSKAPEDRLELPSIPLDFGFTEDHGLARQAARRFLTERSSLDAIRKLVDDETGYDESVWKDLAELGWIGLVAPEDRGGAELDHLHLGLLFEEMGRALLAAPFFGSVLSIATIEGAGSDSQKTRWTPAIASGEIVAALALSEPKPSWDPLAVETTAKPRGDGFVIDGVKTHVLFGHRAGALVVPCQEPNGGVGLYVVELPTQGARVTADVALDTTRRTARVELDGVSVGKDARLEGDAAAALTRAHVLGYAMLACEMSGAIESILQKTREYAIERKQFGRAIGSFQAVKHPIVDMMVGEELVRSLALGAAVALDRAPDEAEVPARMAKALASDTFAFAVRKGVQLHGGYGFTFDCDVHFFFKRAMWSRATLGDGPHHRRMLAAHLFGL